MKFGLLFRPQDPPNAENIGRRWQETLDAAQAAEQAAMVDVISGGRMRLGCGLGALPEEFALYGIDPKTQISRFEEAIGLVREAWSGAELHHQGKHFTATGPTAWRRPSGSGGPASAPSTGSTSSRSPAGWRTASRSWPG